MRSAPCLAALVLAACSATPRPPRVAPAPVAQPRPAVVDRLPAGPVPPPRDDGRLPALVRLTRYDLDLAVDPSLPTFGGAASFDLSVPEPTAHVVLHARDLTVESAVVEQGGERFEATTTTRRAHGAREAAEELVVSLPHSLRAGAARLVVRYRGTFNPELSGLYRVQVDGRWYAFTDFEPADARRAFPCFDEPSFKVPVRVRLTVPQDVGAFANMPESSRADDAAAHTRAVLFDETPPLPSYLVAFAVGPFDVLDGPSAPVPVRVLAPRGRSALGAYAARVAGEHLGLLARYFDRPYPFPKLDLVAVPDFQSGAMENPGLITFRDTALLLDEPRASARSRYYTASIVAHELAHQWFGNLVTMAWWDDLWLNEGFANWMGTRVMDAWQPALGARLESRGGSAWARHADALPTAHAVRQPVTSTGDAMASFDATTYNKGAAVIGMIEAWIGEDPFREGIRAYLRDHAGGNATAADLLAALAASSHQEVAPVAESFLDQVGVPLVRAALDCGAGHPPRVTLTQSRFRYRAETGDATRWRIPVCVRFEAGARPHTQCTVLAEATATVALEAARCPRWIDPNADGTGYYVSATGPTNTRALLRTDGALDTGGQLDLLSNLESLVIAGAVPVTTWLEALGRLAQTPDGHLHERVADSMFLVRRWLVDDANRAAFQHWAARVLVPLERALGWRTHPGDFDVRRNARRSVLSALGMLTDDFNARTQAEAIAEEYLRTPGTVEMEMATVALPVSSRHEGEARFNALLAALPRAATPQDRSLILGAMTTFDNPALVQRAWGLSLGEGIRVVDFRALFGRGDTGARHPGLLAAWAQAHWDEFERRHGRNVRHLLGAVGGLCDAAAIDRAVAFFGPKAEAIDGAARSFALTVEGARQCAAVRARSREAATRWWGPAR
jgi:alanyl aminopeptidase